MELLVKVDDMILIFVVDLSRDCLKMRMISPLEFVFERN